MSPLARFLLLLCWMTAVLSAPGVAQAQTEPSISLEGNTFNILRQEPRSTGERPNWINRTDCFEGSDDRDPTGENLGNYSWVHIQPQITNLQTGTANQTLQIWISQTADCSDPEVRNGQSKNCTLVASKNAKSRIENIYVNPRDVVAMTGDTSWSEDDPAASSDVCQNSETEIGVTYHVLLFKGTDVTAKATWTSAGIDTLAPAPPDTITGAPGDSTVFLEWEIDTESEQTDTQGFGIYCVPQGSVGDPADLGLGGAATVAAAGEGGAGGAGSSCDQSVLIEGALPPDPSYQCGETTGRSTRNGKGDGLTNGVTYAVAVAAKDTVYNDGRVSEVLCLTPKEVTTFFESYKNSGGKGGGGFCGISTRANPSLWWLLLGALVVLLLRKVHRGSRAGIELPPGGQA